MSWKPVAETGTEDADETPFFSPDGEWVGFYANGVLQRVLVADGQPVKIADWAGDTRGADWLADDSVILGARAEGLERVFSGGEVTSLITPDDGRQYWYPQRLPDGRHVLFTASRAVADTADLLLLDLETGSVETMLPGATAGRYTAPGFLVFVRGGDLWAVPFDPVQVEITGEPALVQQGVRVEGGRAVQLAVADDTLVYIPGGSAIAESRTAVWVDRQQGEEPFDVPPQAYAYPRLSPNGTQVALGSTIGGTGEVFVWDLVRGVLRNVTSSEAGDYYALWTLDGDRLIFASDRGGPIRLYWQAADGSGTAEPLTEGGDANAPQFPQSVSRDSTLIYREGGGGGGIINLRRLSLTGDHETADLLSTEFNEPDGEVSPNDRWLAYQSDRGGRYDIYVSPFPDATAGLTQISPAGGTMPAWAPNGRELFYIDAANRLMSVRVDPDQDDFVFDQAVPVLDVSAYFFTSAGRSYDVTDERLLFLKEADAQGGEDAFQQIHVVLNWQEELKRGVAEP